MFGEVELCSSLNKSFLHPLCTSLRRNWRFNRIGLFQFGYTPPKRGSSGFDRTRILGLVILASLLPNCTDDLPASHVGPIPTSR
jgi:hypothetical protein